jgi:hypothetical protein
MYSCRENTLTHLGAANLSRKYSGFLLKKPKNFLTVITTNFR